MKKICTFLVLLCFFTKGFSQNTNDREFIISQTNVEALNQIAEAHWKIQDQFKHKDVRQELLNSDGTKKFFSHFDASGNPVYYSLGNASSAQSSKIDVIRTGGASGLDLDGDAIVFGLWDGGAPRTTHQEFDSNNINVIDITAAAGHATHIAGILIASGVIAGAYGMAPSATIDSYTSSGWNSEVAEWAAAGGLISSHSYVISNPGEDYEKYGIYNIISQSWDALSYNAPYLIMSTGASNNGNNDYNPDGSRYDLLASNKLGKNSIVVGACSDVLNYTGPESVQQAIFTSWGPTDDWRIKPDITAVGTNSYSTREVSDTHYSLGNGSSFAAPIVSGGLALLQQHYHNLNAVYMKAAIAKALILSTADEAGEFDGPDFANGWGLFNAERAAEVISNNGTSALITELTINQDESYSLSIDVDGTKPLTVAICWNDPPSEPFAEELYNDSTPMLINDLDVRVTSASDEFFPWTMEPNESHDNYTDAASKGDNFRDNIEVINVKNIEAGTYSVNINSKGTLQSGSQDFALIINGIKSDVSSHNGVNTAKPTITLFPNPANDFLRIEYDAEKMQDLTLSLHNTIGQKQIETKFSEDTVLELDVRNLPKGTYLLKIHNAIGQLVSSEIVVIQ